MMGFSRGVRRLVLIAAATALVAAIAGLNVERIPKDHVGIGTGRLVKAGWALHAPGARIPTIPERGQIDLDDVALETSEGSRLTFRLDARYAVERALAPQLASDVRRLGFPSAVRSLARTVLSDVARRLDVETLLSEPARTEVPLTAALGAAGLSIESLSLRSTLGDEVIRRRRTQEAQGLAKPPLARILLVGWDGADWQTALPLMAAGRMPNLARLTRAGAWGDLRSNDPMFSPLLWTTIATGKAPTEHGIADFLVKDKATSQRHPITSDFRKVKALWNIFTDFSRDSTWIGWWASFPAEDIRGTIVTDSLAAAVGRAGATGAAAMPGVASPKGALQGKPELLIGAAQVPLEDVRRIIPATDAEYRTAQANIASPAKKDEKSRVDDPIEFVMRVLAQARTYQNIALDRLRSGSPFVAVYFEAIDMMGHGFQHYLPPKLSFVSASDFERFHDAVPNFYAWQDERLGELLAAAGPDAIAMVVSDHGFRTGADRPGFAPSIKGQPEEWHRDWGIVALGGPGIAKGHMPPSSIFDIAPTLLYLNGLPLAEDMPGRLLTNAFESKVVARRAPASTRSYELVGSRLAREQAVAADPEVMREMMANLKALGYVGGSDEPAPASRESTSPSGPAGEPEVADTQFFYHRNLAVSYLRQGRLRDAEAELLRANERQPRAKTYAMLSEVRADDGRIDEAAAALEEGWDKLPKEMEPSSLLWIVELRLISAGPSAGSAAAAKWSSKMTAPVKSAVDGRLAEAAGDLAGAARSYQAALEGDPLLVRVALRLQSIDAAAGRPFALEPFLVRTAESHRQLDAYWDLAGQMALARGEFPVAVDRFRRAAEVEPENATYLGHLATAQAAGGQREPAKETLAWVDRFPPHTSDDWMAVGAAWDRLGETDRAVAAFSKARESRGAGPAACLGEALALARAGRTADARRVLDEGLKKFPDSPPLRQLADRLDAR